MYFNKILTKDFLENELKTKFVVQIAEEVGCCTVTVFKYIKKYKLSTSKHLECKADKSVIKKWFNDVFVLEWVGQGKFKKSLVKCLCYCGKTFITNVTSLKRGLTKSCGYHKTKVCRQRGW